MTVNPNNQTIFSILVYDHTALKSYFIKDYYLGRNIDVTITIPDNSVAGNNVAILMYAGHVGETTGNTIKYSGLSVTKNGNTAVTGATIVSNAADHTLTARWEANTYTVTADPNGGNLAATTGWTIADNKGTKKVTYDQTYGTLPTPTRDGYQFAGWKVKEQINLFADSTNQLVITESPNATEAFTYPFAPIRIRADGGLDLVEGKTYTVQLDVKVSVGTMNWGGRTLFINNNTTTAHHSLGKTTSDTITTTWQTYEGTFTYKRDTDRYTNDTIHIYPHIPANNDTNKISVQATNFKLFEVSNITADTKMTIDADHTLEAQWTPNKYSIKYVANGGSGSMADTACTFDSAITLSNNTFTRANFTFAGWATSTDGSISGLYSGATYTKNTNNLIADASSVKNLTATQNGTVTLYAIWTAKYVPVKLNLNITGSTSVTVNGTVYDKNSTSAPNMYVRAGDSATKSKYSTLRWSESGSEVGLPTLVMTGYRFDGWFSDSAYQNAITNSTEFGVTSEITASNPINIYAKWTPITYKVTYNANKGDSTATVSDTFTFDKAANLKTLAQTGFSRPGYTFQGWATTSAGAKVYNDGAQVTNLANVQDKEVVLYAVWTANGYTIKYVDAGTSTMTPTSYNITSTASLGTPVKAGYTFKAWKATKAEGNWTKDKEYAAGTKLAGMYGDVTLTAQWNPGKSTLTINPNGGTYSGTTPIEGEVGSSVEIADPTRTGYTFKGWSASKSYSGIYDEVTFDGTRETWTANYNAGKAMLGEASEYKFTDFMTINIWAYKSDWTSVASVGEAIISSANDGGVQLEITTTDVQLAYMLVGNSGYSYVSMGKTTDFAAGWHMFTFTFDGMTASGYVDGVL